MIYNDPRPEQIRGTIYFSALILFAGYQCLNAFVPNADLILATRTLAVGFYTAVLYIYGPDAWRALTAPKPKRSDFLIVGIWVSFASHDAQSLYSILYRLAPSQWLLNSEVVSPIVLLAVIGAILHISAPGAVDGTVPRRNRMALGFGVGIATIMVAVLLVTRPDIGPLLERTRPWIGDWWSTGALLGNPASGHG